VYGRETIGRGLCKRHSFKGEGRFKSQQMRPFLKINLRRVTERGRNNGDEAGNSDIVMIRTEKMHPGGKEINMGEPPEKRRRNGKRRRWKLGLSTRPTKKKRVLKIKKERVVDFSAGVPSLYCGGGGIYEGKGIHILKRERNMSERAAGS